MQRNILQGSEFLLYNIDNIPVAYSTNCVLKINQNLSDVTHKDSENWSEYMVGLKDWSIDFDGLVSYGDGFTSSFFLSKYQNSEPFFIKFGVQQENFVHAFYGEVNKALVIFPFRMRVLQYKTDILKLKLILYSGDLLHSISLR
jgi:hypothetical protein